MDEAERRAWSEMGFDPDEVVRDQARREESLGAMWDLLMHGAGAGTDPWRDRDALRGPFPSPFPAEVLGEPDLGPPRVHGRARASGDGLGGRGPGPPGRPRRRPGPRTRGCPPWPGGSTPRPRARASSGALVERTIVGLAEIGLPATFLFVGQHEA